MARTKAKQDKPVGIQKSHQGYRTSLRLQQQVAHLEQLLQQHQQETDEATACHMLLAHAVVLYRVVHHFLQPLYRLWLHSDSTAATEDNSNHAMLLSQLPLVQSDPSNWQVLVQLAASSSSLTRRTLMVTPETVRSAASLSFEGVVELTKECATRMILLSELLSPDRYPPELLASADDQPTASQDGGVDATPTPTGLPEIQEASDQLLARLQEYQALMDKVAITMSVLLAHKPEVLLGLSVVNMETGEQGSPPARHFLQAAKRLQLSSWQVKELQRIRQLLVRITEQAQTTGKQLLGLSADSFSLQAALSGMAPSSGGQSGGSSGVMMSSELQAAAAASSPQQQQNWGIGGSSSEEQDDNDVGVKQESLEQLVQRHMRSLADLVFIEGNWVANVLTPWQHGRYMAACWPFQNRMGALVELSPFLTPHDIPPLQINAAACPTAAAAAALGAELGYVGTDDFMQRRRDALEVQLAWILQDCMP